MTEVAKWLKMCLAAKCYKYAAIPYVSDTDKYIYMIPLTPSQA